MFYDPPNAPTVPEPVPEVPRRKLWTSLMVPPLVTAIATLVLSGVANAGRNYGAELLFVLPLGLVTILICMVPFTQALKVRYRGRGLVLTSIGYLLGQIIVCLCLWFGCCVLVLG
ncbi:hypothetical protein [Luteolibacter marinus]|uniref:hypothetical protein n=1 Tax=Luteolibacter marinus TaxID=2776705 RepID=UPI001868E57D|nr:hypothetical protein [Luteolibacter marinus]